MLRQAALLVVAAVALQQYSAQRRQAQVKRSNKTTTATPASSSVQLLPATLDNAGYVVEIEYCTRCRWMLRAAWMAQELLSTFQADGGKALLRSVMLTPNAEVGGVFQVYLHSAGNAAPRELLWSRKVAGRFPESKELKQIVRDHISPERDLGHSDRKTT